MTDPGSDSDSPWASDDVPVSNDAAPIVWELDPSESAESSTADAAARRWSWRWPVTIIAGLSLVVAGIAWQSATSTDFSAGIDEGAVDDAALPEPEPDSGAPDASDPGATDTDDARPVASSLDGRPIDLPAAVAAIDEPTEIVVRTNDGLIHTLSLPSGRVRTVADPDGASNGSGPVGPGSVQLVASPSATLLAGFDRDVVIAPRDGLPFVVDHSDFGQEGAPLGTQISPIGWIDAGDSDQFLVQTYDAGAGVERVFSVTPDGVVSPVGSGRSVGFTSGVLARGHHVVNDAGGVYLIDADRTSTRISPGTVLAASETEILLRECDEQRQCEFVLQSLDDGARRPAGMLPAQVAAGGYGLSLAPDGTAVSYTTYGQVNERVLVEFADGAIATTSTDYSTTDAWAPDSSGEFLIAEGANGPDGLVFLDRASDAAIPFGDELGQVVGLAVRYPDSELEPTTVVTNTALAVDTRDDVPTGLRLVTYSGVGELTLLDLDGETMATWASLPLPGRDDPQLFAAGDRVGGYTDDNGGAAFVTEFGEISTPLETTRVPTGPLYPGRDGRIWAAPSEPAPGFGIDVELVDLEGNQATDGVRRLQLPDGMILGGDGRGGLVFQSSGDLYASAGEDTERLTSGDLLAIGSSTALVRECSSPLQCDTFVVDRDTGDRTRTGLDPLDGATGADGDRSVSLLGSMSPNGRVALINFVSTGTGEEEPETVEKWFFFDLETGNPVGAEHPDEGQPIVWNDDSSYAAYVADGAVVVYEHATGTFLDIAGPDEVRAITSVGSDFGPGDVPSN